MPYADLLFYSAAKTEINRFCLFTSKKAWFSSKIFAVLDDEVRIPCSWDREAVSEVHTTAQCQFCEKQWFSLVEIKNLILHETDVNGTFNKVDQVDRFIECVCVACQDAQDKFLEENPEGSDSEASPSEAVEFGRLSALPVEFDPLCLNRHITNSVIEQIDYTTEKWEHSLKIQDDAPPAED
nr:MAG: hypothetical protein P1 [Sobemovirus sp.]